MRARALLLMSLVIGLTALALVGAGAGAPAPSRLLTFEDRRTGDLLTIETDLGSPDAGRFSLSVAGRGTFWGIDPASLRPNGPGASEAKILTIRYEGDLELVSQAGPMRMPGRLEGHLDLHHHSAEATLWLGTSRGSSTADSSERIHLVARAASPAGLRQAVEAFRDAMLAGDWSAVYELASSDLRGTDGREAFVASALGHDPDRMTALEVGPIGEVSTHALGFAFVAVEMRAVLQTAAGTRAINYDAYFVLEGSDWRVWFTVER